MMRSILFCKKVNYGMLSRFPCQISKRWNHSEKEDWIKRIEELEKKQKEQENITETCGAMCIGLLIGSLYLTSQINRLENTKQNKGR